MSDFDGLLIHIINANPCNEAEVETKILLHLFTLLGYTDIDRADKPSVEMSFGRDRMGKTPDFIIYDGFERSIAKALITVEAKAIGEPLSEAIDQVKSYVNWAGTPLFVACNGESLVVARFIPGADYTDYAIISINDLARDWDKLAHYVQRQNAILTKERTGYMACYLPEVEKLPAGEFFKDYLARLREQFQNLKIVNTAFDPPSPNELQMPQIPVTVQVYNPEYVTLSNTDVASDLLKVGTRLWVEGDPGSGKTTLARRVVAELADVALSPKSNLIPTLVNLREGMPKDILTALEKACRRLGVRIYPELYRRSIESSDVVHILDGLDEIDVNQAGAGLGPRSEFPDLVSLLESSNHVSIMVTTRRQIENMKTLALESGFKLARVRELMETEIVDLLAKYLPNSQQREPILKGNDLLDSSYE